MYELEKKGKDCKNASYVLMNMTNIDKNRALSAIAEALKENKKTILEANQQDIQVAKQNNKPASFIDRLALNEQRLDQIISGVQQVIALEDPCHHILEEWKHSQLHFKKISVPIGVIGMIYEARPNVSVDAACLCIKAGNVCFLRGSKDTIHSNIALVDTMRKGLKDASFNENFIALLEDTSRESATAFMQLTSYLDLLIPRGGTNLIRSTVENAKVPIIETGTGNCHVYVDKDADMQKAIDIIINAKCQRVSVCNACESILVHQSLTATFMPKCIQAFKDNHVIIHGSKAICKYDDTILLATEVDYATEYLDYEVSIKEVKDIQEAITHINHYSTHHSDVIVTENKKNADLFLQQIDSAVVYHNISSRFSDGEEFGFGAEIGISTQKIHARGPMGLKALTSYKYIVTGDKPIR